MRPYSTIKPSKAKPNDPYKIVPIPPLSVVRQAVTGAKNKDFGRIFRIGYYGQIDGLDCVWLVNEEGEYEKTADHRYLFKSFDVLVISNEKSLYGRNRPKIPPIRRANKGRTQRMPALM